MMVMVMLDERAVDAFSSMVELHSSHAEADSVIAQALPFPTPPLCSF